MTTDTALFDRPWAGRRRFARVGRVLPVALVQIVGTLVASRFSGGFADGTGPPWARHVDAGVGAVALGPLAVALLVAGVVVLPFRWRWPVAVLAVTLGTTIGFALVVSPRGPFVAALTMALANAWFRGHRIPVYVAAGIAQVLLPTADTLMGRAPFPTVTTMTLSLAWLTATIAITELVRVRVARAADARNARAAAERQRADDERVRIARELHDSVAHSMSLINLQAGVALHLGAALPEQTRDSLTSIRDTSRQALVELRTILGVLRAVDGPTGSERNPTPGLDRIPDLVARASDAGVDVRLDVHGDVGVVGGVVDRNAFRIVQESVTNVMKHAPEHSAVVLVDVGADLLEISVTDAPATASGTATEPALRRTSAPSREHGNGITGMRERAAAVGGSLDAGPTADGGWRVVARLPIGEAGTG
ncbi:sensor histidine kinase [Curtobacterium sp. ZW137]|uniref:sensor histidine kinase n=1 Tax=Curtobacterium sp. ZW137 TaxID=2485104 RepID=UPI000F4B62DD|nr:histidine kinase [Curtobacterium sp. ZW137]ROP64778.1 signal transduction histidine kinase [Curtobacterium sp. ZW137]